MYRTIHKTIYKTNIFTRTTSVSVSLRPISSVTDGITNEVINSASYRTLLVYQNPPNQQSVVDHLGFTKQRNLISKITFDLQKVYFSKLL